MASTIGIEDRHDQAGAQAEAQEADDQNDGDGFIERVGEPADRLAHDVRLVRHLDEVDADRELLLQRRRHGAQAVAKHQIVAARTHRHADADRRLAVDHELLCWRVDIAVSDLGELGELVELAADVEIDALQALDIGQLTGDFDEDLVVLGGDDAGRRDGVLVGDRLQHLADIEVEGRQLLRREVEVILLVLLSRKSSPCRRRWRSGTPPWRSPRNPVPAAS